VQLLLQHNAQSDFANLKGTTALMRASQEGHVAISKLLLNSGADVNRKNYEGMNALMLASQRGHADMVMLLITSGASMDEQTAQVTGYYINIYIYASEPLGRLLDSCYHDFTSVQLSRLPHRLPKRLKIFLKFPCPCHPFNKYWSIAML